MIPTPYHFRGVDREAGMHPDVLAEIDAARRRAEAQVSAKPGASRPEACPSMELDMARCRETSCDRIALMKRDLGLLARV